MKKKYSMYTSKEIKPTGWLKRQLEIQAEGLSGNLDKVWPDVRDSKWIGGNKEGWERVPYWLDGFIPLAFLLENEDMIARAKKYIDAIVKNQQKDGWICPCTVEERAGYDTWAVQLISKVLTVYYDCTGDKKILKVLYKTLKNYHDLLKDGSIKLFQWGWARWFETFIALNRLYEKYKEDWIKDLAKILKDQGLDYESCIDRWKHPLYRWTFETHIVNLGMMLKSEAVSSELLNEPYRNVANKLNDILKEYNGTPVELFTGDECLAGLSPIHGTECCAVAEQMYSYELLYAYTGDKKWAERLEVLAFNAFPATNTADMWSHQYDQLSNQMACIKFDVNRSPFGTNDSEAHLFGLEPHYGCCTANFNQAWPKFALSTFMKKRGGIHAAITAPSKLSTKVNGVPVTVELITEYPFRNKLTYKINAENPIKFNFSIRIPSFAENLKVNGETCSVKGNLSFDREWTNDIIEITFDTTTKIIKRPHDLCCVQKGSLVFSVPVQYESKMLEYTDRDVERKFPYCDYEFSPVSDWNYAYTSKDFNVVESEGDEFPFSTENPKLMLETDVVHIDWGFEDGYENICAKTPKSRKPIGEKEKIRLYPYGCTNLRMTEIPFINKK